MAIALITGANSGIGLATAKGLASMGFNLLLIVRSTQKGEATKKEILSHFPNIKIEFEIADLADIKSVIKASEKIKARYLKIDRIINNAGYSPDKIEYTNEGYEKSFIANHLGHFALTTHLLPLIETSEDGRIINISSSAYTFGSAERMFKEFSKDLNTMKAYGDGKLANILFTKALIGKLNNKSVLVFSLHPGVVNSGFGSNFSGINKFMATLMKPFMITPEKGAETSLFLATTPKKELENHNGSYFNKSKVVTIKHKDLSEEVVETIWKKSIAAIDKISNVWKM